MRWGILLTLVVFCAGIPRSAEAIYKSFNFDTPWESVDFAEASELKSTREDLKLVAELVDGKIKPLFPRIV